MKHPGHNTANNHNKTRNGRKKRADRLGTSGLEEQDSSGFPGFFFYIPYILDGEQTTATQKTSKQRHPPHKSPNSSLFSLVKGPGDSPAGQKSFRQ